MAQEKPRYSCPFINQYVKIPRQIMDKVNADFAAEYEGVRHCVGLIVANLLAQGEVAYSRNSNFYTGRRTMHYTRTNMLRAVDIAAERGYAVRSRAGFWNTEYERGLSSTLSPGLRLRELGPHVEMELDVDSLPLLVVDGRQVFDQEGLANAESSTLAPRLADIYADAHRLNRGYWNRMEIGRRNLEDGDLCWDRVGLTRVFTGGGVGRWFQKGELSYQQLPKEKRARLLLDGQEVMELDYPAMHPHILYAWEGQQCPEEFYERIMAVCGCARSVAKMVTLMAVNADSYRALSSAVNLGKRQEAGQSLYDELQEGGLTPREVVQALIQAHPVLEKYVFSGLANRLMLAESDTMTSVLLRLMELDIPALPVHDSIIAPLQHREAAKAAMEDEYRRHTGFGITVE